MSTPHNNAPVGAFGKTVLMPGYAFGGTIVEAAPMYPEVKFIVGGAPVSAEFAQEIGADGYAADPQDDIKILEGFLA